MASLAIRVLPVCLALATASPATFTLPGYNLSFYAGAGFTVGTVISPICRINSKKMHLPSGPVQYPLQGQAWPQGIHYVTIPTLQEARRLFGTENNASRQCRSTVFYRGIESRQRLPQGMHDRGEEYVVANGLIHERDQVGLNNHLPLHVKVIRLPYHRVAAGQVWDISVRHEQWPGLDYMEELYIYLSIDHLVLEPGASIVLFGNVLFSCICVLERVGKHFGPVTSERYDIGILPTPFSVDRQLSPNDGKPGRSGLHGNNGADGFEIGIEGTIFGPRITTLDADTDGQDATGGQQGANGQRGRNGGMCKLADLRIGRLVNFDNRPLRVFSQAGSGNTGGKGGDGGDGGNGGHGKNGATGIDGTVPAGMGGSAGNGGDGGNGGNGGNGGISSNIFLQLPPEYHRFVETMSLDSQNGDGGFGGKGGKGGRAGLPGLMHDGTGLAQPGNDGRSGTDGQPGARGKKRQRGNIFLI